jgi:hypothetical protein
MKENDGGACGTHGRGQKCTRFWWERPKESDRSEWGPVTCCCEYGDETLTSSTMELEEKAHLTEGHGQLVNNPASYSGGPRFKFRPGDWLSWPRFHGFSQSLHANTRIVPYIRSQPTPSLSFQFIIHLSSFHSTLYSLSYWESIVK